MWSLQAKGKDTGAAQKLRSLQQTLRDLAARVKAEREACDRALADGRFPEFTAHLDQLRVHPGYAIDGPWWDVTSKALATAPDDAQLAFYRAAVKCLPLCQTSEEMYNALVESPLLAQPEAVRLAIDWLTKNAHDRLRDRFRMTRLVRRLEMFDTVADLRADVLRTCVAVAQKLEMPDLLADYGNRLGRLVWDTDRPAAQAALEAAAKACPGSLESAQAGWLAAFLAGRETIAQGLLPRAASCLQDDDALPSVRLSPPPWPMGC